MFSTKTLYFAIIIIMLLQIILLWLGLLFAMHLRKTRQSVWSYLSTFGGKKSSASSHVGHEAMTRKIQVNSNDYDPSSFGKRDTELENELRRMKESVNHPVESLANEALRVEGLSKIVDAPKDAVASNDSRTKLVVLNDLWFSVRKGECFGFLVQLNSYPLVFYSFHL
jgi:hypothetical protein